MVTPNKKEIDTNLRLSIQVSLDGLCFCGLSQKDKKIIFFRNVAFDTKQHPAALLGKIKEIYREEIFLREQHPEVIILFSNELYSIVPKEYFDESKAPDYLKFNTKILQTDYVAHDYLPSLNTVTVFIPYTNINNFFFEKYGAFEYRHCISVLTEHLSQETPSSAQQHTVYVNLSTSRFDLIVFHRGNFILANTFDYTSPEDFLYYLLFTAEQLGLDPLVFELYLLGDISEDSVYYQIAYEYVKNIYLLEVQFGLSFEENTTPPKGSRHYTLLKAL